MIINLIGFSYFNLEPFIPANYLTHVQKQFKLRMFANNISNDDTFYQ